MPIYSEPLGRVGGYLGGAAGGAGGAAAGAGGASILDRLGGMAGGALELLDRPRQAVWNLARSGGRALSGEGTWDDALAAVPGALGGLAAGGLAATGFGIPGSLLAGSVLGGVAQDAGHRSAVPTEEQAAQGKQNPFEAMKVSELTKALGGDEDSFLQNMAVGAATDPLSYLGGFGGGKAGAQAGSQLGAKAGAAYGGRLENIAQHAIGPNYPGGSEKLMGTLGQVPTGMGIGTTGLKDVAERYQNILGGPNAQQILQEIEPGSTYLGKGIQTVALKRPSGGVTTLSMPHEGLEAKTALPSLQQVLPPRADIPEILQAARSRPFPVPEVPLEHWTDYSGAAPVRVEHSPFVEIPGSKVNSMPASERDQWVGGVNELERALSERGMTFWDKHAGNIGRTPEGKFIIPDPRAVGIEDAAGKMNYLPGKEQFSPTQGTAVERLLLRLMGADKTIRGELAQKLAQPAGLGRPGGVAPFSGSTAALPIPNPMQPATVPLVR